MKVQSLGHVVIKVRNQQRAEAFYTGVLGLPVAARLEPMHMTFFTLGNHHDVAVMAVEDPAPDAPEHAPGLFHAAFKVGDAVDQRREAKAAVESVGLTVKAYDHGVTKAIYIPDPDGNTVELYVDLSDAWKQHRSWLPRRRRSICKQDPRATQKRNRAHC